MLYIFTNFYSLYDISNTRLYSSTASTKVASPSPREDLPAIRPPSCLWSQNTTKWLENSAYSNLGSFNYLLVVGLLRPACGGRESHDVFASMELNKGLQRNPHLPKNKEKFFEVCWNHSLPLSGCRELLCAFLYEYGHV